MGGFNEKMRGSRVCGLVEATLSDSILVWLSGTSDSEGPEGSQGEIPESEEGLQGGSQEEGRHVKAVRRGNRPGRGMRDSPI